MEVWEKVFVKDADFLESTHGNVGCVICHGGNSQEEEKELAHINIVVAPSVGTSTTCTACHTDIVEAHDNNLHATLSGFESALVARGGDLSEGSALSTAVENHCSECHTSCGQCHVSRPEMSGGGLVSGHEFRESPSMQYNCTACHGSRVGDEYLGNNTGIPADVHWTQASMTCVKCHTDELHGSGEIVESRYQNPVVVKCEDCHQDVWTNTENNPQHEQHLSDLSCQVCHSVAYKNCYGCHVSIDPEGLPCRTSEPSVMQFEIGQNPLRSSERPYKYVVLRHVPTCSGACDFYGTNLFPDFDNVSTWKYATPHNIQLNTPQNESCEACHGNDEIFLTEEDIRPEEMEANKNVIITDIPNP